MATPTLWVYRYGNGWAGHIDWKDGTVSKREGPFGSEAEAGVVVSRMGGMQPPADMLAQWHKEQQGSTQ